jgi:hypothetical protein
VAADELVAARRSSGQLSASTIRRVLLLRSTQTCVGTLVDPFEFPESIYGGGAQAVHLCPVKVIALARVACLRP